ncbi:MAG: glutamate ligase domain-containing protein, partial [Terriglobia bacterium]
ARAPAVRGAFQVENARVAVAAARTLDGHGWSIPDQAIAQGVARVQWPGRLELIRRSPPVFLDGAHNPAAASALARFWEEHLAGCPVHLVYGTLRDKALDEILETLFPRAATVIATEPSSPRAASAELVARLGRGHNPGVRVEPDLRRALFGALEQAGRNGIVFVTGSLFLVGECRRLLLDERAGPPSLRPVLPAPAMPSRSPA